MKTKRLYYYLPKNLIAQESVYPRDRSKLLVFDKRKSKIVHDNFFNLKKYLKKDDILVFNDTKVIPARLLGKRYKGGRPIEIFLLKKLKNGNWKCLVGGKRRHLVERIEFQGSKLIAKIVKKLDNGIWQISFNIKGDRFWREIKKIGFIPTPPYIKKEIQAEKAKKGYYQTVYAKKEGSVAAPTAGFHFTQRLIKELKKKGIDIVFVTLHVGLGTFMPIKERRVEEHKMHPEYFKLNKYTADFLNKAKNDKRRIIAVGTTTARALEFCAATPLPRRKKNLLIPFSGETNLFIKPGYKFKIIDGLISNFHLPYSTLLLLVSAFIGEKDGLKKIKEIYKEAIKKKYRFYSFGDAMFIK